MIMVRSVDFILDIDECTGDTHNYSRNNSTSTNTEGSFNCSCKQGFTGNGHKCEGRILEKLYYPTIYSMWETSKSCVNFHRLASLLVSTGRFIYTYIFVIRPGQIFGFLTGSLVLYTQATGKQKPSFRECIHNDFQKLTLYGI